MCTHACGRVGVQGIINHLDYIASMGFDAIWISPVVANVPGGYHGYWASNLYQSASRTAATLMNATHACP